jgi:serine/threonine-protein kinase
VVIATALLAFLIGALGLRALLPQRAARDDARRLASHEPPTLPSPPLTVIEPSPPLSLVPEASASAPESALAPKPDTSARPKPSATTRVHRPPPAPKNECDPPYTIDQEGHHHYKMECL